MLGFLTQLTTPEIWGEQKSETKHKDIIAARIDPPVYAKNLIKLALRKEINALNVSEIFSKDHRDKIEVNIKVQSYFFTNHGRTDLVGLCPDSELQRDK